MNFKLKVWRQARPAVEERGVEAGDREVVGPEIPDDADIALVEAEVDAAGGDEVDISQRVRLQHALDRSYRWAVDERMAAEQSQPALVGQRQQLFGVAHR